MASSFGICLHRFLLYTYFIIYSIINFGYYSLTKWNAISDPIFVGFKYYQDFFHDADFLMVLKNSLLNVVIFPSNLRFPWG